ncbi:uncharacterized protein LOC142106794 isoform X2 [Mixophyes fleayi]|uniref:uncharacterized protein LOC142106794 isoform X2 n=1 Tax=Mixophyes fleayi TaxID=3061075 RepID=UPI003F4E3452
MSNRNKRKCTSTKPVLDYRKISQYSDHQNIAKVELQSYIEQENILYVQSVQSVLGEMSSPAGKDAAGISDKEREKCQKDAEKAKEMEEKQKEQKIKEAEKAKVKLEKEKEKKIKEAEKAKEKEEKLRERMIKEAEKAREKEKKEKAKRDKKEDKEKQIEAKEAADDFFNKSSSTDATKMFRFPSYLGSSDHGDEDQKLNDATQPESPSPKE